MYTWDRTQVRATRKRVNVSPHKFAIVPESLKFVAAINHLERRLGLNCRLHDSFVFFRLERASRIDNASTGSDVLHCCSQNFDLIRLEPHDVLWRQSPFDLRIAGQRSGARAWSVHQYSIELLRERHSSSIPRDHQHIWL